MTRPVLRVVKFGGTSVAHGLPEVVRRIERSRRLGPTVVVVSAFAGLTDRLRRLAEGASDDLDESPGETETLVGELARRCGDPRSPHLADLRRLAARAVREGGLAGPPRHALLAVGERLAAEAVVRTLRRSGTAAQAVDGTEVLVASDVGGVGRVDLEASCRLARSRLGSLRFQTLRLDDAVPVVTGFLAATGLSEAGLSEAGLPSGAGPVITLGRGASDLTATLLASFLASSLASPSPSAGREAGEEDEEDDVEHEVGTNVEVEIWTDTDGIWSADPNRLPGALPIRHLGHGEAASMARWGARVLHPHTLDPVARLGLPVHVRSTFEPDAPGSRITSRSETERRERPVRAVARKPTRQTSARGEPLVWIAAVGADPQHFDLDEALGTAQETVASRLVERAEGDRPRVEAVLVPDTVADAVERRVHRALVERGAPELRLSA